MDSQIFASLAQDGLTNGAVYALLALALVTVFAVTRIVFVTQGDFLSWGALTMGALEGGHAPATAWVLLVEQNARAALEVADHAYVLETGRIKLEGPSAELRNDPRVIETYLGLNSRHQDRLRA